VAGAAGQGAPGREQGVRGWKMEMWANFWGKFKLGHKTFATSWPRLLRRSSLVSGGLINEQRKVRGQSEKSHKIIVGQAIKQWPRRNNGQDNGSFSRFPFLVLSICAPA